MAVHAGQAVVVLDAHAAPQFASPAGELDHPVPGGLDRRAITSRQVNTDVRAIDVENRMIAGGGKGGGDVLELDWIAQKLRSKLTPLGVIQVLIAVLVAKAESLQLLMPSFDVGRLQIRVFGMSAIRSDKFAVNQLQEGSGV